MRKVDRTARWMRVVGLAIGFAIGLTPLIVSQTGASSTSCTPSSAFWCEDWETVTTVNGLITGYDGPSNNGAGMQILTTQPHLGAKSLAFIYPPGVDSPAGFMYFHFYPSLASGGTTELYSRYYMYFSANWTWDPAGATKSWQMGSDTAGGDVSFYWQVMWGNGQHQVTVLGPHDNLNGYNLTQNIGTTITFQPSQWYCVEDYVKLNSAPGTADGVVRSWIDGALKLEHTGKDFINKAGTKLSWIMFDGAKRPGPDVGTQYAYYDDVVFSTTGPIGCLGSSSPSAPSGSSPSAPSGLTVR